MSAKQLVMPDTCTCCGHPSQTTRQSTATRVEGKRVIRTKTSSWSFPYCNRCDSHDREWPGASVGEVVLFAILTLGIYIYFYVRARQRALRICSAQCVPPRQAIAYLGWHGSVHQFEVASSTFASAFLAANAKKVVGADADARALLAAPAATPPRPKPTPKPTPKSEPRRVDPVEQFLKDTPGRPAPSVAKFDRAFLGPDAIVTVAGRRLEGPHTYVASDSYNADASTIITSARVGNASAAEPLPYWPTYDAASPAQRAVYLDWHATGRSNPQVPIGYVFIHFYGLERRMLVDGEDRDFVLAEVKRLLAIYGGINRSFRGYASSLLAFGALPGIKDASEFAIYAQLGEIAADNPIALSGLLAWFHTHSKPLPAKPAMLVAGSMEDAKGGAVVQRARVELEELFAIRYREKFGAGLQLDAAKRPEHIEYHAASPTLLAAARKLRISVPHVLGRSAQFAPLVQLWNQCVADLKKLSFARREQADAPMTAEAWLALPAELRADYDHPDQEVWESTILALPRAGAFRLISAGKLAELARIKVEEKVTGAKLRRAVEAAALLGYAVEPDPRVVAKTVPNTTDLAIWRTTAVAAPDATLWKSVHTMLLLTLAVALSDGEVLDEEAHTVHALIEDLFALDDSMRNRVAALRYLLTKQPARATTVAKQLKEARTPAELAKVGRVLVAVAAVDGVIVDGEHKALKGLYKAMGLPASDLAVAIVASGARLGSDRTVQVAPSRDGRPGEAIPAPPGTMALNAPAIAAILAETREVAMLLSGVLDNEEDEPEPNPPKPVVGGWSQLDARYHLILHELLTRPTWTMGEVRAIATRAKLMPGAILEAVNSWSEDSFGDHVIEEAGDWRMHPEILERQLS